MRYNIVSFSYMTFEELGAKIVSLCVLSVEFSVVLKWLPSESVIRLDQGTDASIPIRFVLTVARMTLKQLRMLKVC